MSNRVFWTKTLLCLHLFVCCVWLFLFHVREAPPDWTIHIFMLSMLVIQFTWGLTVGLIVGPSPKRRSLLWGSLLTAFMPLWYFGLISLALTQWLGGFGALLYLAAFVTILGCETYSGVMLGIKLHSEPQA